MSIYNYSFTDNNNNEVSLSQFKDKVILIVNVASKCGFTSHYSGLQKLYDNYGDKGLVVIGFPSNQFGQQEPGTDEEIREFCSTNYNVTFPMSKKIDVIGDNAHPIFKYLEQVTGHPVPWNFTKFIINKEEANESIVDNSPETHPESLEISLRYMLGLDK
jgi:glutathione peroxidase